MGLLSRGEDLVGGSGRITSYNVCYTKLLRAKLDRCRIGVEQQQEGAVMDPAAAFIVLLDGITMQQQTQAAGMIHAPFAVRHFLTVRPQPQDVLDVRTLDMTTLEKMPAAEHRMASYNFV